MNMPQGLVPPPLDPMFGKGGIFDGYNEDLVQICGVIILLAMLDLTFVPWLFSAKSRYFALHTVANAIATVASFPDVWRGLTDVETSWEGPSHTMMANSAICAIHIYHCIAFKLSVADIVHHLVFVSILCGLGIAFKTRGGIANNFGCFFLSGLPGGLDYILLVLKCEGYIGKMTEKRLNRYIQQWIRGPSMSIYGFIAWTAWRRGHTAHLHGAVVFLVAFLHFFNGVYYADEAVGSYYTWLERGKHADNTTTAETKKRK
eukprot:m.636663 g.636663  ORF g.636663 m.636663 type:complete len:260 (-) comp22599_c0_seq1:2615-3394(-)